MSQCDQIEEEFFGELHSVITLTDASVATIYRKDVAGGYAAVFNVTNRDAPTPPLVSPASDLAAYLRARSDEPFQMDCDTFADSVVRHGFESYGISHLLATTVDTENDAQYFLVLGAAHQFGTREHSVVVESAKKLSDLLIFDSLHAQQSMCEHSIDLTIVQEELRTLPEHEAGLLLVSGVMQGRSFSGIAHDALAMLGEDAEGLIVEDVNGRLLARSPDGLDEPRSFEWLMDFPRLPYLDWLEQRLVPVVVPECTGHSERGRLIIPLLREEHLIGLISVIGKPERLSRLSTGLLTSLSFACLHLLCRREASRSRVLGRLLNSVENERMRLAFELHDETSQNLVALKVRLSTAQLAFEQGHGQDAIGIVEDCTQIADDILSSINRLSTSLRSSELNYLGFSQAIEASAHTRLDRVGVSFSLLGNAVDVRFNALQETMLLAGLDEALSNCAKHADASQVSISIDDEGSWLAISVRDDGKGFDASAMFADDEHLSYGIRSMRDCAQAIGGDFWIGSSPGRGTLVRFSIPKHMLEEAGDE